MSESNERLVVEKLDDLSSRVNTDILEKLKEQHRRAEIADDNYLTDLQKMVFSNEDFWELDKNIIVRGRTSSGKTMIAEIATAYFGTKERLDMEHEQSKIIYLVPLRAMVAEKREEFISIFEKSLQWKVYASSSDYQDHDEDIIQGRFKIAIIVYEKFFSLLAQDNRFIAQCSLIVVDELQMLGSEDRGAKLEVALTKITIDNPKCKILGLTTLQCDTQYVKTWLEATEIECGQRPKSLYEYIVWPEKINADSDKNHSKFMFHYYVNEELSNNKKKPSDNIKHEESKVLFNRSVTVDLKRKNFEKLLVPDLVNCILNEDKAEKNKESKIIIFINNKNSVEELAKTLSKYLEDNGVEKKTIYDNDERIFDLKDSEEENVDLFLNNILPYGVAYHHGGLSRTMREFVEEEFRKSGGYINIVVATETLAIGVNMPADTVILVGVTLPRGNNRNNSMKSSEYKNCIGRAGRLGINSANVGKSYLIATTQGQANDYWERYVNAKPVNIMSYMLNMNEKQKAPYMLNLVNQNSFELEDYEEKANKGFIHYCTEENRKKIARGEEIGFPEKITEMYEEQLDALVTVNMLEKNIGNYETTRLGDALSRYALSVSTVKIITNIQTKVYEYLERETDYFEKIRQTDNTLKMYEAKTLMLQFFDKFFLDILFELCTTVEACKGFEENVDSNYTSSAIKYLIKKKSMLLPNGSLFKIVEKYENVYMELPNQSKSKALRNAILLCEWSKGTHIKKIRKETGLTYAKIGDVSRLGDVVAYLWEAMAYALQKSGASAWQAGSLAKRSGRIKYGVPDDIVLLASRHVPYLSREQLIKIRSEAEKEGIDAISYVRNINNVDKTSIPSRTFKALSRALQMFYAEDIPYTENRYLYKKDLISYEAYEILDNFKDKNCLDAEDFVSLFSNRPKNVDVKLMCNYVKIDGIRSNENIIIYPFVQSINSDWIKSVCNDMERLKKACSQKMHVIFLTCDSIDINKEYNQMSYDFFLKLYKYSLQKIGNINPVLDILTMDYNLRDENMVEPLIKMYEGKDICDELHNKVHEYIRRSKNNSVNMQITNSNVDIRDSNIASLQNNMIIPQNAYKKGEDGMSIQVNNCSINNQENYEGGCQVTKHVYKGL